METEENVLNELEIFFNAFADKTRLRIILHLLNNNESTVQELSKALGKSQSLISHHLAYLRGCGVVSVEKRGKFSYYSIKDEDVKEILRRALQHAMKYSESILSCKLLRDEEE